MAPQAAQSSRILVASLPTLDGHVVTTVYGVVSGHAICGANMFRDLFASIRDTVGGRATSYERVMRKAEEMAIIELQAEAAARGANAVLSMRINHEPIRAKGNLLMAVAYGTAVTLART